MSARQQGKTMLSIKELVGSMAEYLFDQVQRKLTGKLVFTLHFKCGGVGRCEVDIKHDLTLNRQEGSKGLHDSTF